MTEKKTKKHFKPDDELLRALACGATVEVAAQKAKVSVRTAYRRLEDPEFQQALKTLRQRMTWRTAGMLTAASGEAVKTLVHLLGANHSSASRLGASKAILELGPKFRDSEEFEERLRQLEERFIEGDHTLT